MKAILNLGKPKLVAGIDLFLQPDNSLLVQLVLLEKKGTAVEIKQQTGPLHTLKELKPLIPEKTPLLISLQGKGILHKKIKKLSGQQPDNYLQKALPNANPEDFHVQLTDIDEDACFISLIRRNSLDELLEQLKTNELTNLVTIQLGPFSLNTLVPVLDKTITGIAIPSQLLTISEKHISNIQTTENNDEKQYTIGSDTISSGFITAFAIGLCYFSGNIQGIRDSDSLNRFINNYRERQKFEKRALSFLLSCLLVLLVNYVVFDHYWSLNRSLENQLGGKQVELKRLNNLKQELEQKKSFLEDSGLLEQTPTSYYSDLLASTLPATINWTELSIRPEKKESTQGEENKIPSFEKKMIRIKGNCNQSSLLNDWMKQLKTVQWISQVSLIDYKQTNSKEAGNFLLEIEVN